MHKLRKPRAITQNPSQTLTNNVVTTSISTATRSGPSNTGTIISSRLDHQISSPKSSSTGFGYTTGASFHPRYAVEQYWAVRALTAETLLSSRTSHQQELRSLSFAEEMRRSVSYIDIFGTEIYQDGDNPTLLTEGALCVGDGKRGETC